MAKLFDRVKFNVSGTPGTGTVTIGTRYDSSFYLPDEQGAVDGDKVFYIVQKANRDEETGIGTLASGQTTITRDIVLSSIVSGIKGTSKINIDSTAFMALVTPAYANKSLRVVREVTGSTDTVSDGDGGGFVIYNRATAIAVTLPQAGASSQFLNGWYCFYRNDNTGTATITPTTSTINGASSLPLANGDATLIISDGANYRAIVWHSATTAETLQNKTLGSGCTTTTQSADDNSTKLASTAYVDRKVTSGHIYGLTLSNNTTDATNDLDIAAGSAADSTNAALMTLASGITKQIDAAWAVGTNQGGLDTGSPTNVPYHIWLIQRSDTGVVDVLISTSATSPTMPANYDRKRRIGSIIRSAGVIKPFIQDGDDFAWKDPVVDLNAVASLGTSAVTQNLSVPTGIRVKANVQISMIAVGAGGNVAVLASDLSTSDSVPSSAVCSLLTMNGAAAAAPASIYTNTSGQIRSRQNLSNSATYLSIVTFGWIDKRR